MYILIKLEGQNEAGTQVILHYSELMDATNKEQCITYSEKVEGQIRAQDKESLL